MIETGRKLFPLLALPAVVAHADSVLLDNGDRLSGTVVKMADAVLVFETPYAGTLRLPWDRVREIGTDTAVRLRLADGMELSGRLQGDTPGYLRVSLGTLAETVLLGVAGIAAINPPRDVHRTVLSGRASIGGSLARGNTDTDSLHLSGEFVARNPTQRITLDGERNEASQDGADTASNWRFGMKYDHFVDPRTYFYVNSRFDQDAQADLDLRSMLGVGAGRQLLERDTLKLAIEGGVSLVNEDYANAADEQFPGARFGLRYEQALLQSRLQLYHTSDLVLSLESLDDYLYQSRTGFRVPVGNGLNLGTQLNLDYDAVPAAGKESTDMALIFKLDYAL